MTCDGRCVTCDGGCVKATRIMRTPLSSLADANVYDETLGRCSIVFFEISNGEPVDFSREETREIPMQQPLVTTRE